MLDLIASSLILCGYAVCRPPKVSAIHIYKAFDNDPATYPLAYNNAIFQVKISVKAIAAEKGKQLNEELYMKTFS